MGCFLSVFTSIGSTIAYCVERVTTCSICTMLICCLIVTIVTAAIFGIALGYHYCITEAFHKESIKKMRRIVKHNLSLIPKETPPP